ALPSKGAMISHGNLAEGAVNIVPFAGDIVLSDPNPRLLMFLPLAHILARAVQYFCLVADIQVAHTSDTSNVTKIMQAYQPTWLDRKSTRLNSSHVSISYAVFCLKKNTMMLE